jgi:phytoene dehydrogenase-like protein
MTMSAADFVEQWFESEPLKATLSASGIIGTFLGPRSPGTAYVLLHHYMGEIDGAYRAWGFHKGGTGGLAEYLARAAEAQGAEVRCNAGVAKRSDQATAAPPASCWTTATRFALRSSSPASTPSRRSCAWSTRATAG